jgi:hypothetical protein
MQVQNSNISLVSKREYTKEFHHSKSLRAWKDNVAQEPTKTTDSALDLDKNIKNTSKEQAYI